MKDEEEKHRTIYRFTDNNDGDEKPTATKKCVLKRKLKCQDYKNCLEASQKIQLM